jgi:hypothetical protein
MRDSPLARTLLDSGVMPRLSTDMPRAAWRLPLALTTLLALGAPTTVRAQDAFDGGAVAVAAARDEAARTRAAVDALRTSRAALAGQSEALALEITRRKATAPAGLLPTAERAALDARLKQHQALVGQLALIDRQIVEAERGAAAAHAGHVGLIDAEIARLRAGLAQGDAATRKQRFERLRSLVAERSRLGAPTADAPDPARNEPVRLPAVDPARIGPGEAEALADETRDHADHVRKQLESLVLRLAQLQSRRRMLRSAQAFTRDAALFAEDERVRRVVSARADTAGAVDARSVGGTTVAVGDRTPTGGATSGGEVSGAARDEVAPQAGAGEAESGAPPPAAEGASNGAGADSDGAFGAGTDDAAAPGTGVTSDPSLPPPVEPPPIAMPAGVAFEAGGAGVQPALVIQDALDPQLLTVDVGSLSPDALAEQIRRLEARRRDLEKTVRQLDSRRDALDRLEQGVSTDGE